MSSWHVGNYTESVISSSYLSGKKSKLFIMYIGGCGDVLNKKLFPSIGFWTCNPKIGSLISYPLDCAINWQNDFLLWHDKNCTI